MILAIFEEIEHAADKLGLKDIFGDPLLPEMAVSVVARYFGSAWDEVAEKLKHGMLTPQEYRDKCMTMIDQYGRWRQMKRVDEKLAIKREEQFELKTKENKYG